MPLSFILLFLIRKLNSFEGNLQGYTVINTNVCHLLIIVIFTKVPSPIMPRIIWFADCINNNKLGLKSPAHPAFDCQTIYFSDKMFMDFSAERNYILLSDITWHLLLPGNTIFKILSKKVSGLKVQYLVHIK